MVSKLKFVKKYGKDLNSYEQVHINYVPSKDSHVGYDIIYENIISGSILKSLGSRIFSKVHLITSFNTKNKKVKEEWVKTPRYYYTIIIPNAKKKGYDDYYVKDLKTAKEYAKYKILEKWEEPKVIKVSKRRTGKVKSRKLDEKRRALPPGKRISKYGKVYYEYRKNRSDVGNI